MDVKLRRVTLGLGVVCNALSTPAVSEGWVVLGRSDVF